MLTMCQYIERQNVERFIKCLSTETDPAKRTILLILLSEERGNHVQTILDQAKLLKCLPRVPSRTRSQSIRLYSRSSLTQVRLYSALLVTVEKCNESFDSVCRIRDHLDCFGVLITSYIDRLASPKSGASRCWQCFFWPRRFMDNRCFGDGWIAQNLQGEAEQLRSRAHR